MILSNYKKVKPSRKFEKGDLTKSGKKQLEYKPRRKIKQDDVTELRKNKIEYKPKRKIE